MQNKDIYSHIIRFYPNLLTLKSRRYPINNDKTVKFVFHKCQGYCLA